MGLFSSERLQAGFGLADAGKADVASEDGHGFKQRRRVFAAADGDPDGLEGLPSLQTQVRGCCSKRLSSESEPETGSNEGVAGIEPIEDKGARAAHVQEARGRGRKTYVLCFRCRRSGIKHRKSSFHSRC